MPLQPKNCGFQSVSLPGERAGTFGAVGALLLCVVSLLSLASCAGYTSQANNQTAGTPPPSSGVLTPTSASVSFGNVAVGSTSTQSVGVTNTGSVTVNITGGSISGSAFTVVSGGGSTSLAAGQSATIQVQFAPTGITPATGTLTVASDASNSSLGIALSGTGTEAIPSFQPTSVTFNNATIGQNTTQNVTLSNNGNVNLVVTAAVVSGAGFGISNFNLPVTVGAGSSTTFAVTFNATSSSTVTGNILFTDNAIGATQSFALSGTGAPQQAQISANPTGVTFGNVVVQNTNSQPVILTNNGNITLTFSQITVSGTGFGQTGLSTSTTIAAGAHMTFNATFDPPSAGAVTGSIVLTTNGTPSPLTINLSGTGQASTLLLSANPTNLPFGNVLNGSSSQLTSSITNNGNSTVTVSGVTTSGTGFTSSGVSNGTMIGAGQSATLTVTFAPTTGGAVSGSVNIASNATNGPTAVTMSGTGVHNVQLQWQASPTSGVTYNLLRGTTSGGESTTPVNTSPISGVIFTDNTVTAGQTYYYEVVAVNSAGSSAPSNEASAQVPTP